MYLWILAAVAAYFIKGLCGFANTLVFTSILSFGVANANISPIDLLLGYPTNLILTWKNRRSLDPKVYLPLAALVLAGSIPGAFLLKHVDARAVKVLFGVVVAALGAEMFSREYSKKRLRSSKIVLAIIGVTAGVLCGLFGVGAPYRNFIFLGISDGLGAGIVTDGKLRAQTFFFTVFCNHQNFVLYCMSYIFRFIRFSVKCNLTGIERIQSENGTTDFTSSCTYQAGHSDNFPFSDFKGNVFKHSVTAKIFRFKSHISNRKNFFRIYIVNGTPDHVCDNGILRKITGRSADNTLSVTDDSDIICDFKNLFHFVTDIKETDSLLSQLIYFFKKLFDFLIGN